jgi:hypothetical protein
VDRATDRLDAQDTRAVDDDGEPHASAYDGNETTRPGERRHGTRQRQHRARDHPRIRRETDPGIGESFPDPLEVFVPAEPLIRREVERDHRRAVPTDVAGAVVAACDPSRRHGTGRQQQNRPRSRHVVLAADVEPAGCIDVEAAVQGTERDIEKEHDDGAEQQEARRSAQDPVSR